MKNGFNRHSAIYRSINKYCKIPKYLDTEKFVVIILKFEQAGLTIEKLVKKK